MVIYSKNFMWINSSGEYKLLFVTLSLTVLSTVFFLNFNTAFSQNGDVSYLDVNGTNSLQLSKFSVAAWFKTSTDYNSNAFIVNKAGASNNMNYGIWMTTAETIRGGFETSSGSAFYATSPLSYSDGNWHYAVVTFDGSAIGLYLDGLPVATKTASASPDSGGEEPIRMGADSQTLTNYFIGNVDEIRIWKNALTPQQVIDAYNGNFNPQDLVEYLDFSEPIVPVNTTAPVNATENNQTEIPDNNGTLNNGTGPITPPVSDNTTSNTNDTGSNNDTTTGDQQTPPQQVNNPPEASGKTISVDQDKQIDITLEATDKNNDPLQFDITADPSQGSLKDFDNEKGTVTYVPKEGYFGDDKFSFKVTDDKGSESNNADVNININEVTPPSQNQQNEENNAIENTQNTTQSEENANANTSTNTNTNTQALAQPNQPPIADAGDDQKAEVNTEVKLDAVDSSDQDGEIVSYKWEQTDGPKVDLKDSDKQVAVFDVPESAADSNLVFKLIVTDDKDDTGEDEVTVDVEQIPQDESDSEDEST
jgi:hypothetical protein